MRSAEVSFWCGENPSKPKCEISDGFPNYDLNSICNLPQIYVLGACDGLLSLICASPSGCSHGDWTIVGNGPFMQCMYSSFLNI